MTEIGDLSEVRDLIGITDELDVPDTRIETALGYGRGELYSMTGQASAYWNNTAHPLYQKAKMIVEFFAAYWILIRYAGFAERAGFLREQITILTDSFKKEFDQYLMSIEPSGGGPTSRFSVVASKYQSYPLNSDAEVTARSSVIIPGD